MIEWCTQEELDFRGEEYIVSLAGSPEDTSFTVQVESKTSADQWRAVFEKQYIEELTHKTGNFKQFDIFFSMLESAIMESSDSVSLELLTYSDLEALRSQRPSNTHRKNELSSKRYLILVYSVEFDRIHYPLPLPYVGKPDPVALQEEIRELKQALKDSSTNTNKVQSSSNRSQEVIQLRREIAQLKEERDEIIAEFDLFKQEMADQQSTKNPSKEMKVLRGVIKSLENELLVEKSKNQRANNKKTQDYNRLLDEIEEARSSERSLKARVKSLSNELAMYKKSNVRRAPVSNSPRVARNDRGPDRVRTLNLSNSSSTRRPASRDRSSESQRLSRSRERSLDRNSASGRISNRSRSNSPVAGRQAATNRSRETTPRFDPTAYVKQREERLRSQQTRRSRERLPQNVRQGRNRSNSFDRRSGGGGGGLMSGDESDCSVRSSGSRMSQRSLTGKVTGSLTGKGSGVTRRASTPDKHANSRNHRNSEISNTLNASTDLEEIDARLNALQEFMKLNL